MTSHSASQKVIINHYYKIFQIHFLYSLRKHPLLLALCTTTFQFIIQHYKCLRLTRLHDNIVDMLFTSEYFTHVIPLVPDGNLSYM